MEKNIVLRRVSCCKQGVRGQTLCAHRPELHSLQADFAGVFYCRNEKVYIEMFLKEDFLIKCGLVRIFLCPELSSMMEMTF